MCRGVNEHEANGMLTALGEVSSVEALALDSEVTSKFLSVMTMEAARCDSTRREVAA